METQQTYPGWFLWLAERSPFSWLSLILLVFLVLIGLACYLDSRIETQLARIERELHFRPPETSATAVSISILITEDPPLGAIPALITADRKSVIIFGTTPSTGWEK